MPSEPGALRQGEILTGLVQVKLAVGSLFPIGDEQRILEEVIHPFVIVASQDCDLDWDYKARKSISSKGEIEVGADKMMPNIIFCEANTASALKSSPGINSEIWKRVRQNKDERYQFLEQVSPEQDSLKEGVAELGVDFKRYFTIPTAEVYARLEKNEFKRRCRLDHPYLQHFMTRYGNFQSRVALPAEHQSEPQI